MPEHLINWPLIKNPVNWVVVLLMLIIVGIAIDLVLMALVPRSSSA